MTGNSRLKELLKQEAAMLGFSFCGVARARRLDEEEQRLSDWLKAGHHGQMKYMENHFEMRLDPCKLVPGAKTVIVLMFNYFTEKRQPIEAPKVASYAHGEDYHHVLKEKLRALMQKLSEEVGEINGRVFVDSAPVMERQWAALAGLGWTGKNTLLINPKAGSYFFLAEIISDLDLAPDSPMRDYCGTCTACIDACPTAAITPYQVDASKCISYLTIELRDELPKDFAGKMENWAFGCDICQQVCPWNRFSKPHDEPRFKPTGNWIDWNLEQWQELTEEVFQQLFKKSALKRTSYKGIKRNIAFLKGGK